jgi:long-chain acyl-CoA synthetase
VTRAEQVQDAVEGLTITALLRRNARDHPDHPALTSGINPDATTLTWAGLRDEVAAVAQGLAAVGLHRGDRMLIAMSKRPEHWVADLAAAHLGAISCTLYDTLSTAQTRYIARHSAASVVVLEGAEQWDRWRPIIDDLPDLRAVVALDPAIVPPGDRRFVTYADLRGNGAAGDFRDAFEKLTDAATPDEPLCAVYTSGTTGDPKGVVLSHRNVIHQSVMQEFLVPVPEHPRSVSYLPMAHIAERVLGIYLPICTAGHVTICPDPTELLPSLVAVRPHGLFGVPRVWEKMVAGLQARLAALPEDQAALLQQPREVALQVFRLRAERAEVPAELAAKFEQVDPFLRQIRAGMGLDASTRNFSGAAPIPVSVLEFLASIGLPVYEVWGLSETSGCATVSTPECFSFGAVGAAAPGIAVRCAEDGELLVRGPVVFRGYLRADGGLDDATDADGWFATGDIGRIDERGLVWVTDRKKEIIITAGGKNIAPTRIESLLRTNPLIGQAVAIGDRRPYVTALVVLDEEAAPAWAKARGIDAVALAELAAHSAVLAEIDGAVRQANQALSRAEQVKAHRVLDVAWTAESGELTPKLSLRRSVIDERYAAEIDRLYS